MESLIYLSVFLLLAIVVILLCGLDRNIDQTLAFTRKIRGKKQAIGAAKETVSKRISKLEKKRKGLLAQTELSQTTYRLMTVAGVICGAAIGKLFFQGTLFVVLVGTMGGFVPLLYLTFQKAKNRSRRMDKIRSSMMILSGSYIVTEDFIQSVRENLEVLDEPKPFRDFLIYVTYLDGNVKLALRRLENQVNNIYFSQWIDVLIMAQDDRSLKYVTMSVVDAMNNVAQAQLEADTATYAVWREYFVVLMLIFSAPLIFKLLMPDAYIILVTSTIGRSLLVLLIFAVVYSVIRALKLNKPLLM